MVEKFVPKGNLNELFLQNACLWTEQRIWAEQSGALKHAAPPNPAGIALSS